MSAGVSGGAPWRIVAGCAMAALGQLSCITPPVVAEAHREGWTLLESSYPRDAKIVEIARVAADGRSVAPTLRGLFVPSDPGAPIVVHFAESAGSVTSSMHGRGQYHALAELGFASLAVDYSGVGLSDGEPSPRELGADALAIWSYALEMAGGDASQLVVRGASLGTVAASSLLAAGVEPAAVLAFAPVRPETVATRYGYALFWDAFVWLASPFLRTFIDADPLEWLTKPGVARFVVASPEDELLGERDFERLRAGVEASGGVCLVPERLFTMIINDDPVMEALSKHIALTQRSYSVGEEEEAFLGQLGLGVPNVDLRLDRIRRVGPEEAVERVWAEGDALARLTQLISRYRRPPVRLALAAAMQLTGEELSSFDGWFAKPFGRGFYESIVELSMEELGRLLDLDDLGGRLSIETIAAARRIFADEFDSEHRPRWTRQRVEAFADALDGVVVPGKVFRKGGSKLGEGERWRFGVRDGDQVRFAEPKLSGALYVQALVVAYEADLEGRTATEGARRLRRCLLKAAGLP